MRGPFFAISAACALVCAFVSPGGALAESAADFAPAAAVANPPELPPYLQCVPYARQRSGVQIYGDALTWWDQAAGRYQRGSRPRPGAVMAFRPSGGMVLGHVAAVAKVIDTRTVLLDHANWSPIDGRRGQIERGVRAVDVSAANDWSQVRVWYDPLQSLGTTAWPVAGFIYNEQEAGVPANRAPALALAVPISPAPSRRFSEAFAGMGTPIALVALPNRTLASPPVRRATPVARRADPLDAALARYDR